ncbi:MAG: hypothetical protein WCO25_01700 [Candidatus Uhrbacteria bacterium]
MRVLSNLFVLCVFAAFAGLMVDTAWENVQAWGLQSHTLRTAHGWSEIKGEHPRVLKAPVSGFFLVLTDDGAYDTNYNLDPAVATELNLLASN